MDLQTVQSNHRYRKKNGNATDLRSSMMRPSKNESRIEFNNVDQFRSFLFFLLRRNIIRCVMAFMDNLVTGGNIDNAVQWMREFCALRLYWESFTRHLQKTISLIYDLLRCLCHHRDDVTTEEELRFCCCCGFIGRWSIVFDKVTTPSSDRVTNLILKVYETSCKLIVALGYQEEDVELETFHT